MLENEKKLIKCKNNSKFISEMLEEDKKITNFLNIPDKILKELDNYPDNFLCEDKNSGWKIIDFNVKLDGSSSLISIKKENETDYSMMEITSPSTDITFEIEKDQLKEGILVEISEKTFNKHVENNTFLDKDLIKFKVVSTFLTVKEELDTLVEKKDGKTIKKKDFGGLKINGK